MCINIQFPFDKYGGGGNQFLKALRKRFKEQNIYEDSHIKARVILFNSHHSFNRVLSIKKNHPGKIFIHRIDGPIHLVRGRNKELDEIIYKFNKVVADGIIFQSDWCRELNEKESGISSKYETVIHNAPDSKIFNRIEKIEFGKNKKIKLISTSNSSNWRKGFDIYKYLDENLDFSRYEMTFVGNSPIDFKNIKWIKWVPSLKLAGILRRHDIYINASQNDPCSNSLIEALCCGLPAVALNNGGHPELVKKGGELFNKKEDIIEKIERIVKDYKAYQSQIPKFSIEEVALKYYEFAQRIWRDIQNGKYKSKELNLLSQVDFYRLKFIILRWKGLNKIRALKSILWKN